MKIFTPNMESKSLTVAIVILACASVFSGCAFERHSLGNLEQSQFIEVASGDDWYFRLRDPEGASWMLSCDDPDVKIEVKRGDSDGQKKVHVHIHRGYDGPSTIQIVCRDRKSGSVTKTINLGLFKRTGDEAFWK